MWQRIQTVLIVLAMVCMVLAMTLPLTVLAEQDAAGSLSAFDLFGEGISLLIPAWLPYAFAGGTLLSLILMALSVTQYKQLSKQIRTNRLATLFIMLAMVSLYFGMQSLITEGKGSREIAFYAPVLALLLNVFAGIQMRRDQMKISSLDRLR